MSDGAVNRVPWVVPHVFSEDIQAFFTSLSRNAGRLNNALTNANGHGSTVGLQAAYETQI